MAPRDGKWHSHLNSRLRTFPVKKKSSKVVDLEGILGLKEKWQQASVATLEC